MGNILYTLNMDNQLVTMDLETLEFSTDDNFQIAAQPTRFACIVASENYVFIIDKDQFQIFSFSNSTWLSRTPTMNIQRHYSSCNVVNDHLYVIGGWSEEPTDSIEYINI